MNYLQLPNKRPEYRQDRSHDEFLVKLNTFYGDNPYIFFEDMKDAVAQHIIVEESSLQDVLQIINADSLGGMQQWFEQCRTSLVSI